jgi:LAO/AO transport system kinase
MGKDVILVETVGVGQDEVDVVKSAHTTVIVVVPGMGDDIQTIKAGILEIGDIFVINKADREGADKTFNDLKAMIDMDYRKFEELGWQPPILKTEALSDQGIAGLLEEIDKHRRTLFETQGGARYLSKKENQIRQELAEMIKDRLIEEVVHTITETGEFERAVQSIMAGKMDPYTATENLVRSKINGLRD